MLSHLKIRPRMLLALAPLALVGCASPTRAPTAAGAPRPPFNQGNSWEVVLSRGEVAGTMSDIPLGALPEHARNDGMLNPRLNRLGTAQDQWPQAQPELWRRRYLDLPRQPGRYIYFLPQGADPYRPW